MTAVPSATGAPTWSRPVQILAHQIRYDALVHLRNRQARFFTIALPIGMLFLFASIFGTSNFGPNNHYIPASTYYVATQVAFGAVDAAFMSLAMYIVSTRESGILKRRRATPQPAWTIVISRAVTAVGTSLVVSVLLLLIGRMAFAASVPARSLVPLGVTVLVGSFAFCCLGFAVSSLVNSVESAQPVVMASSLPLFFVSGVFIPWALIPHWLQYVAAVFPVRHFAAAALAPLTSASGAGWRPWDLAIVFAWGVVGMVVASRRFGWAPRSAGSA